MKCAILYRNRRVSAVFNAVVGKKAGIENIHPHMFRHTFVSILLSNPNIGVATVAAEAGHAQPSTTLAIYTQVYDRRRDEIRKQMSKELYKWDCSIRQKEKARDAKSRAFLVGHEGFEPPLERL